MSHFKRGKRKNARSGCLLCKAHKANGVKGCLRSQSWQEQRARLAEAEQRRELDSRW